MASESGVATCADIFIPIVGNKSIFDKTLNTISASKVIVDSFAIWSWCNIGVADNKAVAYDILIVRKCHLPVELSPINSTIPESVRTACSAMTKTMFPLPSYK